MKAYKGFDKDMKCRGFQFAEGETYHEDTAELCTRGFHACTIPLDVFKYYIPGDGSIYREVELDEVDTEHTSEDSKVCAKTVKVGAELGISGLVKAQIEWVKNAILSDDTVKNANTPPDKHATGNLGAASATGDQGAALSSGLNGRVMGTLGCAIFAVERDNLTYKILSVGAAIVDGDHIKPNVWYTLKDGEFVEVE